ncbi:MAG TPA: M23 family metallopeptidase [Thermoanaerobaculia bacterium]|nr:M23 family metallopeptidase [Thermoanaerobaculia bacterium]
MLPLFILTILLPLVVIAMLWRRARLPRGGWIATFIVSLGVVGFSVFVAPWGVFGLPMRYALVVLFLAAIVRSLRRAPEPDARQESPVRAIVKVMLGFSFGAVAVGALQGHAVPPGAIDLSFPLRGGSFLVAHGGSTSPSNMHHSHPAQTYALDVARLNAAGMRARAIFPPDPRQYAIFGAPVVSPCDGVVIAAVDGLPDTRDEKRVAGNHVIVRCRDADVWLAHLQRGSVAVRAGSRVRTGELLGRVGSSGNATEPHLHVHAERNGRGVPVTFNGDWLVRNDVVRR